MAFRTSYAQFVTMVDFMEKNGDLSKPTGGPRGRQWCNLKWRELSEKLNSEGAGESRTEDRWRKVWSDLKNNTKKKWAKIHKAAKGTGGGPALKMTLTDVEDRVMAIMGVQAAAGMPVPEVGFAGQVLCALSFFATGSYQHLVGMAKSLGQTSVSKYVGEVTEALNHPNITNTFIKFPTLANERELIKQKFYRKYGIPGVCGCIDGSHFRIFTPNKNIEHLFYSRKHYHSLNVQINNDTRFSADKDAINNIFTFILVKDVEQLRFEVKGRSQPNHPPYVISLKINGVENCKEPIRTYFQDYDIGVAKLYENAPDKFCGRRRINRRYTELVVSGSATAAGDWPWHAAIMRLQKSTIKYIGGGTLISKYVILTAAHCAAINGVPVNPETVNVILGKYTLVARDIALQEKEVFKVIVHEEFDHRTLNNDIALMKLSTEAIFNNYVQPACLWFDGIYDHLGSYDIKGTVVGWGFDNTDSLSTKLKSAAMPKVSDYTCIKFDPIFYSNILNGKRFCAGNANGTAACNGDSGGGFMVFVEDEPNANIGYIGVEGAWYVRGIVSVSLARYDAAICDPNAYTVFTDVAIYKDWILNNMN